MCGRHMRSRDRRLCESLERKFCDSSRDFRRNERFCEELGFRYYEFDGDAYELVENSDNSGSSAEDFDFEYEDEDEFEFDVSNEGSEDMMLMKGGDSSNFMQMSKGGSDKSEKTKKVRLDMYHVL